MSHKLTIVAIAAAFSITQAHGQIHPIYTSHFQDPTMKNSRFEHGDTCHWTVSPGADNFSADQYERPTSQTYELTKGKFATKGTYFGNLDIEMASYGYDSTYLYVSINLVDSIEYDFSKNTEREGLKYNYRFRVNTAANGAGGFLFSAQSPTSMGTTFQGSKSFGFRDVNGDLDRKGNGYEVVIISDGKFGSTNALYTRVNPSDPTVVEFALKYNVIGLNPATISSVVFESNKGLGGPGNYPWNKHYSGSEAGSPNKGSGNLSEFGTSGLGNVYELDTLKGVPGGGPSGSANTPPTGNLSIARNMYLQGKTIPVGYKINR